MLQESSLNNQLLVAMPNLIEPEFARTVIYLCEHKEHGAIGLIVNRPMVYSLQFVFEQMEIEVSRLDINSLPLLYGGPIQQDRGFVIHKPEGDWRSSLALDEHVSVTTSRDILQAIAHGDGPQDMLVTLGYAGWGAQQLDEELKHNAWLVCEPTAELLFHTPFEYRWEASAATLGVNINTLIPDVGHA